ncbi:hypothetical protein [uncultured Roseibium sp.]|uniref:hypothetical protein n=1 Tax=uncultured Roseibium sp. TaxID=1936171 RepID=UPI00261D6D3D|nr:hypothetical protein [uncultured Roseibium sp.]
MQPNLDTSFFSIICELGSSLYTPEIELTDMRRLQLVEDIRNGQIENVRAVLEFNPEEGWCNNITEEVLAEATDDDRSANAGSVENWSNYETERIEAQRAGVRRRVAA